MKSRRQFLAHGTMGVLGAALVAAQTTQEQKPAEAKPAEPTAGAPPAFGTAQPVGPEGLVQEGLDSGGVFRLLEFDDDGHGRFLLRRGGRLTVGGTFCERKLAEGRFGQTTGTAGKRPARPARRRSRSIAFTL